MALIEQICGHIHNFFTHENSRPILLLQGTFTVTDGALTLEGFKPGNYYLIKGSDFNDGVHVYPSDDLTDETFTGSIYKMRPPREFLSLVDEIKAWQEKYGDITQSPYQSESVIGVYSYQLKATGKTTGESDATWQSIFGSRLKRWRKLYELT